MSGVLLLLPLLQTVQPGVLTADEYLWPYPFVGLDTEWTMDSLWLQSGGVFSLYDSIFEGARTNDLVLQISGLPADVVELEIQCNSAWHIHGYSSWPNCWAYCELSASLDYPFEEIFFHRLESCGGEVGSFNDEGTEMLVHCFADTGDSAIYVFRGTNAVSFAAEAYTQWTLEDFMLIGHTTASLEQETWARIKAAFL